MMFDKRNVKLGMVLGAGLMVSVGAMAQALPEAPPTPPAPPAPPAHPVPPIPPSPPAIAEGHARVVVVEHHEGVHGAAHVRTATRDGKTFVLKTHTPLSDEEFERRIAKAEDDLPQVPEQSLHHKEHRIVVVKDSKSGAKTVIDEGRIERHAMAKAISGIRSARAAIAGNRPLSNEIRAEVLRELDAEIAKLQVKS
ncbi:MAG: hypothetical protein B7Y74_13970 [Novosphingobium sp. 35-62-5]|nr:MAG: hypothetical protein B7Y74_13970 [Novosphingobium sp. 35-62-5]